MASDSWTITRDLCGPWTPSLQVLYAGAGIATFAAYVVLFVLLRGSVRHARRLMAEGRNPEPLSLVEKIWIWKVYAGFILSCGIGHLEAPLSFVWPHYPTFAGWHLVTACTSWAAVIVTIKYRFRVVMGF